MRLSAAGLGVFLALIGCGKSAVDAGAGGTSSEPLAGAPNDAGGSGAGATPSASGSSAVGGSAGAGGRGGSTSDGGRSGGGASAGGETASGGSASSGGSDDGALLDCDPKKVLCKRTPPTCEGFTVPEVVDGCYGECVNIARCACDSADDCPDQNQFTCWSKQHCGPFLQ